MASLDDVVTVGNNLVNKLAALTLTLSRVFTTSTGGTASSATSGGASPLPGPPAGYLNVTLPNGNSAKVPFYNP